MNVKEALIEERLKKPLRPVIDQLRAEGASWREIAKILEVRTGVVVSYQSVRNWSSEGTATPAAEKAASA